MERKRQAALDRQNAIAAQNSYVVLSMTGLICNVCIISGRKQNVTTVSSGGSGNRAEVVTMHQDVTQVATRSTLLTR